MAVVIISLYLISKYRKATLKNRITDLVAWTVSEDSYTHRDGLPLRWYVERAQTNIADEYRIADEAEWEMIGDIFGTFKKDLNEQMFADRLIIPKTKYLISGEDYFMLSLVSYLKNHQCDGMFIGHNMHEKNISYKDYGSWGGRLYEATYVLTKFAVVFNKLYYIAYCYCKNSKSINPDGKSFYSENGIEEIISSKTISISAVG